MPNSNPSVHNSRDLSGVFYSLKIKCACGKVTQAGTKWSETPPDNHNMYRVECLHCGSFIKWGTRLNLETLKQLNIPFSFRPYPKPIQGPTLHILEFDLSEDTEPQRIPD
jgi:hypothetical protein